MSGIDKISVFVIIVALWGLTFCGGGLFQCWWQMNTKVGRDWLEKDIKRHEVVESSRERSPAAKRK